MEIDIEIRFPGGKRVDAAVNSFIVETDQSVDEGGQGAAPEPFDFFFVSIGTCAGLYASEFCKSRGLGTDGLKIGLRAERDEKTKLFDPIRIILSVPANFPQKYRKAIVRAVNMCTVKRHIEGNIRIETVIRD